MKLNQGSAHGSFGIPPEMKEAVARAQEKKEEEVTPAELTESVEEKADIDKTPMELLKDVEAEFTNEDFDRVLTKGYYQKKLVVLKGHKTVEAVFKTLTGEEYDEVDELLATETKNISMTQEGYTARRAMLILSYGVYEVNNTRLDGTKVGVKTSDSTTKELALKRRKALNLMSPAVSGKLGHIHGTITFAINRIMSEPEVHLKNS